MEHHESTISEDECVHVGSHIRRRLNFDNGIDLNFSTEQDKYEEMTNLVNSNDRVNLVHSKIRKEQVPAIGMEFETEEEAFMFYNTYAYNFGFSIRRSSLHRFNDGRLKDRLYVCSAQGIRGDDKRDVNVKKHRAETRFGCLARMKISFTKNNKYEVVDFFAHHTHITTTPSKSHLFRSQRKMSIANTTQADIAEASGIAPRETMEFLSRQSGGPQNVGFINVDYKNYLRSKRMIRMKIGDTGGVLEYLQKMQSKDPNFVYAIQVDEDDLITNIFWADARMMVDYDYFGDVVSFDTTHRKNKDGRPFAMFVGVNNHRQTIIFGAALLYDETAETFMWLFDTFAETMSGKKPKCIFTDQDAAMAKALASQWPESCHRLCIWHMFQNAAKHLSHEFHKFNDFTKDFNKCVYSYEDEEEFIDAWRKMLAKYDLGNNVWLNTLFSLREKWALVYGRDTFCAEMTTTQRSESLNSVIRKYISYTYDLVLFFEHFERMVDSRRNNELEMDFRASQSYPSMTLPVKILTHAAAIYTPSVFELFQKELCTGHDCVLNIISENETVSKYAVTPHGKKYHRTVVFDSLNNDVSCSCRKFEFAGYLCSHALKVLSEKNIKAIPTQYILNRWTKDIKSGSRRGVSKLVGENDKKIDIIRRYRDLCRLHVQLATRASESEEAYEIAFLALNNTLKDVDASLRGLKIQENLENQDIPTAVDEESNLNAPVNDDNCNVKGIKIRQKTAIDMSSERPKNALEIAVSKKRTSKTVEPLSNIGNVPVSVVPRQRKKRTSKAVEPPSNIGNVPVSVVPRQRKKRTSKAVEPPSNVEIVPASIVQQQIFNVPQVQDPRALSGTMGMSSSEVVAAPVHMHPMPVIYYMGGYVPLSNYQQHPVFGGYRQHPTGLVGLLQEQAQLRGTQHFDQ